MFVRVEDKQISINENKLFTLKPIIASLAFCWAALSKILDFSNILVIALILWWN